MSDLECGLADRDCAPCRGGVPALDDEGVAPLLADLNAGWRVIDGHHLHKTYRFPDWKQAQAFVDAIGDLAERQGHHPDLQLSWGRVAVEVHTHAINGLAEADFVLAAKIERLANA